MEYYSQVMSGITHRIVTGWWGIIILMKTVWWLFYNVSFLQCKKRPTNCQFMSCCWIKELVISTSRKSAWQVPCKVILWCGHKAKENDLMLKKCSYFNDTMYPWSVHGPRQFSCFMCDSQTLSRTGKTTFQPQMQWSRVMTDEMTAQIHNYFS